MIMKE